MSSPISLTEGLVMAKRQTKKTTKAVEVAEYENGFDAFGQPIGAKKGEPDQEALDLIKSANEADEGSELEPLIDVSKAVKAEAKSSSPSLLEQILDEAKDDPDAKKRLVDLLSSAPNAQEVLGVETGKGVPSGVYNRNYREEEAMRVYGGVEVDHPPGWEPMAPSWLPMYHAVDGGTTYLEDKAAKNEDGTLKKTEEYKTWLDHHKNGTKMDGNVRFDISAEETLPDDVGALHR